MRQEPEKPLRLGIAPVGLGFVGFLVMIAFATGGMWFLNLIMAFFRWMES